MKFINYNLNIKSYINVGQYIFYLFILSMNSTLIFTGSDWIMLNILAIISICIGIWYSY